MLFPPSGGRRTGIELLPSDDGLPVVAWAGLVPAEGFGPGPAPEAGPGLPLLGEHAHRRLTRPHLRGHRILPGDDPLASGRSWTTWFVAGPPVVDGQALRLDAS